MRWGCLAVVAAAVAAAAAAAVCARRATSAGRSSARYRARGYCQRPSRCAAEHTIVFDRGEDAAAGAAVPAPPPYHLVECLDGAVDAERCLQVDLLLAHAPLTLRRTPVAITHRRWHRRCPLGPRLVVEVTRRRREHRGTQAQHRRRAAAAAAAARAPR